MPVEIERKFLVIGDAWRAASTPRRLVQGYLSRDPDRVVRVRITDDGASMTVKGRPVGITRSEIEFAISQDDAEAMIALCFSPVVEKTRHKLPRGDFTWEIDEFHGQNSGLIVAEIELPSEDAEFEHPSWLGLEVTDDFRYSNSYLSEHPFQSW